MEGGRRGRRKSKKRSAPAPAPARGRELAQLLGPPGRLPLASRLLGQWLPWTVGPAAAEQLRLPVDKTRGLVLRAARTSRGAKEVAVTYIAIPGAIAPRGSISLAGGSETLACERPRGGCSHARGQKKGPKLEGEVCASLE